MNKHDFNKAVHRQLATDPRHEHWMPKDVKAVLKDTLGGLQKQFQEREMVEITKLHQVEPP